MLLYSTLVFLPIRGIYVVSSKDESKYNYNIFKFLIN